MLFFRIRHLISYFTCESSDLVCAQFIPWRTELLNSEPPATLKELLASLTPPQGVKGKAFAASPDVSYVDAAAGLE